MPLTQSSRVVTSMPKNWKNWKNNVRDDVEILFGEMCQPLHPERPPRPEHRDPQKVLIHINKMVM